MGNVVAHGAQRKDINGQSSESVATSYAAATGRLVGTAGLNSQSAMVYTDAGDRAFVQQASGQGGPHGRIDDAHYYYRADGLLVAVDRRTCALNFTSTNCQSDSVTVTGAFEDYRYDALGRRVLVRTRTDHICAGSTCVSALMWVAWDGSAIAEEVRGQGSDTVSENALEQGIGGGPFYGTVAYLNGPIGLQLMPKWAAVERGKFMCK